MTAVAVQEAFEMPDPGTETDPRSGTVTVGQGDAERLSNLQGRRDFDDLPFAHGCGARWSGLSTAHCARCHRTFGGVSSFDRHRKDGACVDPADVGLSLLTGKAYPCWGMPHTEPSE